MGLGGGAATEAWAEDGCWDSRGNDAVVKVSVTNVILAVSHRHVPLKRYGRDGLQGEMASVQGEVAWQAPSS